MRRFTRDSNGTLNFQSWQDGSLGQSSWPDARILFGQAREDADVELALVETLREPQHIFVIASGGCTALSLLTASAAKVSVSAVDINPAQVFLNVAQVGSADQTTFSIRAGFVHLRWCRVYE
jgi:hypothetical protein